METNFELGETYVGKIRFIRPFGIIVECEEGEGWIHISELDNRHIDSIFDEYEIDEEITMKCIGIDDRGRVRMSHRAIACAELGIEYEPTALPPRITSHSKYGSGKRSRRTERTTYNAQSAFASGDELNSYSERRTSSRYNNIPGGQNSRSNLMRTPKAPYRSNRSNGRMRRNLEQQSNFSEFNSNYSERHEDAKNRSNILGLNNRFRPNTKNRRVAKFNHFGHQTGKNSKN